jgi:hypothetical protein
MYEQYHLNLTCMNSTILIFISTHAQSNLFIKVIEVNLQLCRSYMLLVLIWSLLYLLAPVQKTVVITPEEFNKLKTEGVLKFSQPTTTNVQRPLQVISPTISNPTIQVISHNVVSSTPHLSGIRTHNFRFS